MSADQADSPPPSPRHCRGACPKVQLYQAIAFAAPVLFASLLLLLFCLLYVKRRHGLNIRSPMRGQFFAAGLMVDTLPLEHGLSKSFRLRLPIIAFDEKFVSNYRDTQCTVCLGDYQMGEKIQQLPGCNHTFHVQCIDEWLAKNVTCPVCRASVLVEKDGSGSFEAADCEDDGSNGMAGDHHDRWWEERVVSEAQDQSFFIRINGTSSGAWPASEVATINSCVSVGEPAATAIMDRS